MCDLDDLFAALEENNTRSRIRLGPREQAYLASQTLPVILEHARGFINERLAPRSRPTTASKRPGTAIRFSWPSTPRPPAAANALRNGITSSAESRCVQKK